MPARSKERETFLSDIIFTAIASGEDGIGYWAQAETFDPDAIERGEPVTLREDLENAGTWDGEPLTLNRSAVARGIRRILSGEVGVNSRLRGYVAAGDAENDAGEIDSHAADVIVQAGVLNEIRYG